MMRNRLAGFLAILLVTATVLGVMPAIKAQPPAPAMWIEPTTLNFNTTNTHVGDKFNVTVWGSTASDVFTYQASVLFNTSQLQVDRLGFTAGSASQWFAGHSTVAVKNINNSTGIATGGETLLAPDVVSASSGSIMWVEFEIETAPGAGTTLTSNLDTNSIRSYLVDPNGNKMTGVTFGHATYTFSAGGTPPPTRHDVAVSSVTPSSDHVSQNDTLPITVVALNNGTVTETFDVNATYDGTLIGKQTVTSLAAGSTQSLTFSWNTTGVAAGNYTITATATPVAGQTDLSNQAKTATVQVLVPRHDVVVSSVSASSSVTQGVPLLVSVVVLNNGTVAESSVVVNAMANETLIGAQTVASLGVGNATTLTFTWNTTAVSVGTYTVTGTVTPVVNQTDLAGVSKSVTVQVLAVSVGQYYLAVSSAYDSPTPSSGLFNAGASITESVTSPVSGGSGVQYVCTGWTGTGSVPASGTASSVTFVITQASSIVWNWKTQYQVTFSESGVGSDFVGTVVTVDGVNYAVTGLPVSFWWDSGSSHSFSFASPLAVNASKQYSWVSTSGLSNLQSGALTVTVSGSVVANYAVKTPLLLTVPLWLILAFIMGIGIVGAFVLLSLVLTLRKAKRKKPGRSYAMLVHPHV